ncbi:hypothetical protein M8C21_033300 [Ambrosia artemisiifolia]|uniref:Small ribosomal subunit protein mS41 SAM domain-containing protein n=1 Tax=Ambrosia artemisiifolia TaxID=4212 RepID=A0AAD5BVM7_AMBAR|nr:hypothetical protein M8C21_033300 [Ambrosia artemisiifolia]
MNEGAEKVTGLTPWGFSDVVVVKVGIPEFLNGIGNGVETYAEKLEAEFGDLQNLLVARSMKLKKLNVGADPKVCKHVVYGGIAVYDVNALFLMSMML